jgi:hypothetical protein
MTGVVAMFEVATKTAGENHGEVLAVLERALSSVSQAVDRGDHARMVALALLHGYFRPGNESVRASRRAAIALCTLLKYGCQCPVTLSNAFLS